MDDIAVRAAGLSFSYERSEEEALKHISLEIQKGKFVAVMGETGAGKSTLLMALNGLVPQFFEGRFRGDVVVQGLSTRQVPVQNRTQTLGMVLQDPDTQIFGVTVWEDAAFGPSNLGVPLEEIRMRVGEALRLVGLSGYEERQTETLSGGEKQRLAAAGVLAMGPDILVLDEPTSGLDPEGKEALFRILRELQREKGMTVIVAEHDSELVLAHADEVHVMQRGELAWSGSPQKLFADEARVRAFRLRPPGVAQVYWRLAAEGADLGPECPRSTAELKARLDRVLAGASGAAAAGETAAGAHRPDRARPDVRAQVTEAELAPAAVREPILQITGLHHQYPNGYEALKGVSLDIREGEYLAVIGRNGAGKSTMCKHLNRLLEPTQGRILFEGKDIADKETWQLASDIGYVFQNPDHQIFCASVLEEVGYGLKMKGLSAAEQRNKAMEAIAFVGLESWIDRHPFALGKGLRQRLAAASILTLEPKVLVIDEPTAGQDWPGEENMLDLIRRLHRRGHTIIAITHSIRIAVEQADRTVVMSGGRVLREGPAAEIFADAEVLSTAGVRPPQAAELAALLGKELASAAPILTSSALSGAVLERMGRRA